MTRVKVIGAGSIGNHLSNASRRLGWQVDLVDNDPKALERTRLRRPALLVFVIASGLYLPLLGV